MDPFGENPRGVNRFTLNARRIIANAYELALKNSYDEFQLIHLFYALLLDKNGIVNEIFNRVGIDIDSTIKRIEEDFTANVLHDQVPKRKGDISFSAEVKDLLNQSFVVASNLGHVYVGSEHLLLAMFELENVNFVEELKKAGITFEVLKRTILAIGNYANLPQAMRSEQDLGDMRSAPSSLQFFSKNMNDFALEGEYMNITGRDEEIKRLINILARKTKNNPILVGDAGVGKTAIVEGLVNRIVQKKVPASFLNKRVVSLDVSGILAGARLRGDVEERINAVISEVVGEGNVILFIDEIHTIVGAGTAGARDTMDIANILKPYLTSSDLSVIGATTADEYSKYFETDSALSRRFQPIFVDELDVESAKKVMNGIAKDFEDYHNVKIRSEAINVAVDLSSKFIKDRYLPDKAIDLIDEAAAAVKVGREIALEPELNDLGASLIDIQSKKEKALQDNNYKAASEFKEQEDSVIGEIEDVVEGKKKAGKSYSKVVTPEIVKHIVVEWTKIPIAASDVSDKRLKNLSINLKKRIVGQNKTIDNVALAIQRSHLGLNGDLRPLASFLFLGPTGVGKSELAKQLAKELFGSDNLLYQINMSEFMELHSVSKLIGSPPGYVGYQEGGQLTSFVKRKPYSVILFDEIEKAHPDVLNLLLQILEEGILTDGKGNTVSLRNCIIIMTSNIGAEDISNDSKLGFNIELDDLKDEEVDIAYEDMRSQILDELKLAIRPEILNRIDLVDIFRGLNKDDCIAIAKNAVNDFIIRILPKGIYLTVNDDVVKLINEEGYSKEYGGRNIRRKSQELLENGLTEFLLTSKIAKKRKEGIKVNAETKDKKIVFRMA